MNVTYTVEVREVHISYRTVILPEGSYTDDYIVDKALDTYDDEFLEYSHLLPNQDYNVKKVDTQ